MVTNSAMLSTSERNNMGRERLLTCLAERGAETVPVVLFELQKAYFNKFEEYLNKAELRKFFSIGHIKLVFENFMSKDVEMFTDVNSTGSMFLKMKRPLEVAIADSPKTAPLLAVPNGVSNGSNHRPPPHLVPLPASEPSAASRKRRVIIFQPQFVLDLPRVNVEADDGCKLCDAVLDAALEDGHQRLLKMTQSRQAASAYSRSAAIAPFAGRGEAVSAGKWTGGARGGAGRGYNGGGTSDRFRRHGDKNNVAAAGGGGLLLDKKWAQERLEDDAVVTERLRNRKREQHQSVAATHYNDCWNGDDEVTTAAAPRNTRASQQQRVAAVGVGVAGAQTPPYEEEEGGEVKEKRKVAEEEVPDEDDEEEDGQMTNMSLQAVYGDYDETVAGHETTTPEELHDEETEEFYQKFAVGTSRNNKAKQTSWGESGSKKFPVNYFVGLISTVMCMLKNVTHNELDKKLECITYRAAFPSPADLLVFITNHCHNIQTFKVSKTEVALLWSESSDEQMSQLLHEIGMTILANKDGNSPSKQ